MADSTADRAGLRDRIAEALIVWTYRGKDPEHGGILKTVRANAYSRADAVLAVLLGPIPAGIDVASWTAIRAIQLMNEAGREAEEHRLALSQTLGLSTDAPWAAMHERVAELRRMADEAQQPESYRPARGDAVEHWLKTRRDISTSWSRWHVLDSLLDEYRLHADTGTPLGEHACDGPHCDCGEAQQPETPAAVSQPDEGQPS